MTTDVPVGDQPVPEHDQPPPEDVPPSPDTWKTAQEAADAGWLTLEQAAAEYNLSSKTIRRRITAGKLEGRKLFADEAGGDRWMVKPPPARRAEVIPMEALRRIEELHIELREAVRLAQKAETVAEFQTQRREQVEAERDAIRAEVERLRADLEAERNHRWWQRRQK